LSSKFNSIKSHNKRHHIVQLHTRVRASHLKREIPCERNRLPELTNAPCTLIAPLADANREVGHTDDDFHKEEDGVDDQQSDDAGLALHRGKNVVESKIHSTVGILTI